jgi:hypothetical protein
MAFTHSRITYATHLVIGAGPVANIGIRIPARTRKARLERNPVHVYKLNTKALIRLMLQRGMFFRSEFREPSRWSRHTFIIVDESFLAVWPLKRKHNA